jgi:hypothetical protein
VATGARTSFWDYLREAFNARPIGMFIAPNWVGLAAVGLAGWLHDPGWLVLGAGLELGYLTMLATHPRFQRFVQGKLSAGASGDGERRLQALVSTLPDLDKRRYAALAQRCQAILEQQFPGDRSAPGYDSQSDSLGRLTWMYLRLLVTRQAIQRIVREGPATRAPGDPPPIPGSSGTQRIEQRIADLERKLRESLSDDLRRSLTSQLDLLRQRSARRSEAEQKLAFLDAELARIEEQVELIREQAVLSTDPELFSQRIDEISATLGSTGQWIAEQQQTLGAMDDLISEPPPLTAQTRARELH